jgi:hypothetical protein
VLEVEVYRDGKIYKQTYARGAKASELRSSARPSTGTMLRFKADAQIMEDHRVLLRDPPQAPARTRLPDGHDEPAHHAGRRAHRQTEEFLFPEG